MILVAIFYSLIHYLGGWGSFLAFVSFSYILLVAFIQHHENTLLPAAIARSFTLLGQSWGKLYGLSTIILLLLISFLMILSAPVLYFNTEILQWNVSKTDVWAQHVITFLEAFIKLFGFNLTIPILAAASSLLYFSLREITSADYLQRSIEMVGNRISKKR